MIKNAIKTLHERERGCFDLFRLSHAKEAVDLAPNTIRKFNRQGLNIYRKGKIAFVSRQELEAFLTS
jgi:hypothetical protein